MKDASKAAPATVENLVALLDTMQPFLDASSQCFCYLPHEEHEKQMIFRMDDCRVRYFLVYRYFEVHKDCPSRADVQTAIALVQGRLLKTRRGPRLVSDDPTFVLFLAAAREREGWAGPAAKVISLLRETQQNRRLLKVGTECVPDSPTAMGIWLVNNQLRLLAYGIELYRPTRRSASRLWAWRIIIEAEEGDDGLGERVSPLASLRKSKENNEMEQKNGKNDTCDTCVDDQLRNALKGALS